MKTQWVCDDCYKQECLNIGKELESYTVPNFFETVCNICKNNIGTYYINKHETCRHCKFWRFIRNEDYGEWKGSHGECNKITDYYHDENAWIDGYTTYTDYDGRLEENNIVYPIRMKSDLAGNDLIVSSVLITKPNFGCNLFEDRE